jgi:hypothetical protein
MTNLDRLSAKVSSDSVGRCEISMVFLYLLLDIRYLMPTGCWPAGRPTNCYDGRRPRNDYFE